MEAVIEKECSALGGLFQTIISDMKGSYPVWEDFINKAGKLQSQLRTTVVAAAAFLDAFQKVADMATNTRAHYENIYLAFIVELCGVPECDDTVTCVRNTATHSFIYSSYITTTTTTTITITTIIITTIIIIIIIIIITIITIILIILALMRKITKLKLEEDRYSRERSCISVYMTEESVFVLRGVRLESAGSQSFWDQGSHSEEVQGGFRLFVIIFGIIIDAREKFGTILKEDSYCKTQMKPLREPQAEP
ncbi:hypothetical protein STEG23_010932, partial [Scotinomys teguina]